jgi:hypothetical protein
MRGESVPGSGRSGGTQPAFGSSAVNEYLRLVGSGWEWHGLVGGGGRTYEMKGCQVMRKCSLLVLALGIAATAGMARADQKRYSPVECVVETNFTHLAPYYTGWMFNHNTTLIGVYCPVVMDENPLSSSGNTFIYLLDNNYNEDFACSLRSQSPTSSSAYYSSVSTSGTSSVPLKYRFSATSYYDDGIRYIRCYIPARYQGNSSAITAYSVDEG